MPLANTKSRLFRNVIVVFIFAFVTTSTFAQGWSVSKKTSELTQGATIYIECAYQKPDAHAGTNDFLGGTAFLISDNNKIYLVTAKHLVVATLTGKNQQSANNSIFISTSQQKDNKGLKLSGLNDWGLYKKPFVFSSDKLDIAIISFQKNKYKALLATILKQARKPIPIDSLDTSNHYPGDSFYLPTYFSGKYKNGERMWRKGIGMGRIKTFDKKSATFTIENVVNPANNGCPIFLNDKIIGILTNEDGILSNGEPFRTAKSANVTKIEYLLPLLRKLQQNENSPGFN